MVATLKVKMLKLYQTSLKLLKVEKAQNFLLINIKYVIKISSL